VDAYVTEIEVPVPLTADLRVDDLQLKQEYAAFLEQTELGQRRPQASFETKLPGQYERLLEHISFHRWLLGKQRGSEVPLAEAALSWYDHVYLPLVEAVREQGVVKALPNTSETDLYLWIIKYQWYLREAYTDELPGEEVSPRAAKQEAARQLAEEAPQAVVRRLVNVLKRGDWIDALVLKLEQTAFLEQTRLAELRPDANVVTTVPGQYEKLSEHIAVHRWYLGESSRRSAYAGQWFLVRSCLFAAGRAAAPAENIGTIPRPDGNRPVLVGDRTPGLFRSRLWGRSIAGRCGSQSSRPGRKRQGRRCRQWYGAPGHKWQGGPDRKR
jgi:hypothetical protein